MRITPLVLLLSACSLDPVLDDTSDDLRVFQHVIGEPNPRPEVGLWGGHDPLRGCTATLVRSNWAILAAHCWAWFDGRIVPGVPSTFEAFNTLGDGMNITQAVATDRTFAFSNFTGEIGANDVLLAHLSASPSRPTNIVPAAIATTHPANGLAGVEWGLGCTTIGGTSDGRLRAMDVTTGQINNTGCEGDSGGPTFLGAWGTRGPIYAINSYRSNFGDGYGDPVALSGTLTNVMNDWDANGWADVYANGWCTGANERRFEIDADGNGQPDALCWNSLTGAEKLAVGFNRLIRPSSLVLGSFCSGGRELLTGDFDGDRISDLLCHDRSTGQNFIDFGRDGYNGFGGSTIAVPNFGWCSHSTGQLHTGDFNGDGRTDLLCHDTATGHKWLDYAAATTTIFAGTDYESTNNFCSHVGAKLIVGDVDGNGMSDLICHTPSTGQIHVDRTYPSDLFHGVDFTLDPTSGLAFCASGRVEVGDYDGDNRSDLKCVTSNGTFWSLWADSAGTFSYNDGRTFGFGGDVSQRTVNAASRPWSYER